ncbi:MAG: hypothetical protein IJW70_08540 [Clostridia bacterium]|nr:hypothetical protein [Clostridia bacterium]
MNERDNEKLNSTEIVTDNGAINKLQNFWYHNKWTVIVVTFFVCVLLVCTVQMLGKDKYDVTVLCGTTVHMDAEQRAAFLSAVQNVLPEDYDKNGEKSVGMVDYQVFSEDELYVEVETVIDGVETTLIEEQVAAYWNTDQFNSLKDAVAKTGEYSLCFASPYVYETLLSGYVADGKAVRLGDTDFYRYNEAVQVLPEDTVICLLRQFAVGESSKDDIYERSSALYDAIISYDVQE